MSEEPITQDELIEMFGESMPIEAAQLVWDAPDWMTVGQVRTQLRELAAKKKGSERPTIVSVTMRDGDGETMYECRFSDGQKFAAITVDDIMGDKFKDDLLHLLNGLLLIMPFDATDAMLEAGWAKFKRTISNGNISSASMLGVYRAMKSAWERQNST